ncbi:protein ripply1-like [Hemitrygon akajei]|uniref:protein ripply1-like n=1 Tax=Hemitrygon akajei TaxID=2704970 RepID=UPI003BF99EE5
MDVDTQRVHRVPACPCPQCLHGDGASHPSAERSAAALWRPWLITPEDIEREQQRQMANTNLSSEQLRQTSSGDKVPAFQHPVKLLWPKSKCFDYLFEDAAYLLANFPVQATISFYQESDSESESEDND